MYKLLQLFKAHPNDVQAHIHHLINYFRCTGATINDYIYEYVANIGEEPDEQYMTYILEAYGILYN